MNADNYLKMQKNTYDKKTQGWSVKKKSHYPIGGYEEHNAWEDYDTYLFSYVEKEKRKDLVALEYGCGPGRNIVKYSSVFKRVDGVDISDTCITAAKSNIANAQIQSNVLLCDGKSIPFSDESYDAVFSVICLQHICVHEIRYNIMKEVYRVLKAGGSFSFQMGYGGQTNRQTYSYYDNIYNASNTNGLADVSIHDPKNIEDDLLEIGFKNYKYDIRPTGPKCKHRNWIWCEVKK